MLENTKDKYAIIGAGPAGLAAAKNLRQLNIAFDGFESAADVGGLWNIENENSTVYESAHLISSKTMTEFRDFPMSEHIADYPHHSELCHYFQDYAKNFQLYEHYHFNTPVQQIERLEKGWQLTTESGETAPYKGIIIANGTLSHPNMPKFKGTFTGKLLHSSKYKSPRLFTDQRVLIIGAGNSGCDIAVDAVHHAKSVTMSVRRGYHFVPKYVLGKPADTIGGMLTFPPKIKQKLDKFLLGFFTLDATKYGFPEPDHKLYESHPIVNSLILYHLGHGDLKIKGDIERFDGQQIHFKDGTQEEFDIVLMATGYKLNFPFIDKNHLNWNGASPKLYLNIFHPIYNDLFVMGMVEAAGIGWQGRDEQAELLAQFIHHLQKNSPKAKTFIEKKQPPFPDLSGGFKYMKLDRMAYYVHKETYRNAVRKGIAFFKNK